MSSMQISTAVQAIALILVFAGWIVTNRQNNKRETRKEGRSACDAAKKCALEISSIGRSYLCTRKNELAFEIKSELDLLEIELSRIPYFGVGHNSTLMKKYIDFSDSLTGYDFEQKDAPLLAPTDARVQSIIRKRNLLLHEVERQFKLQFC